jgi:hypothetical protein
VFGANNPGKEPSSEMARATNQDQSGYGSGEPQSQSALKSSPRPLLYFHSFHVHGGGHFESAQLAKKIGGDGLIGRHAFQVARWNVMRDAFPSLGRCQKRIAV